MSSHAAPHVRHPAQGGCCLGSLIGGVIRTTLMAAGGWIAYSHLKVDHQVPLPKAIPADQQLIAFKPTGSLNLYADVQAEGRPLLLVHSVNAAASAYEMRPLFQHYRERRPVYALDLPGFGFSTRPDTDHTPDLFVQALLAALRHIDGAPADIIALSLGSEFAAQAARQRPDLVRSLTLLSPSGFSQKPQNGAAQAADPQERAGRLHKLFSVRLWARPFYDLLTTRRGIEFYLRKSFAGPITPGMVDYAYATAHQPGAEYAPLAFVSGKLFTLNAADAIYRDVATPTLVIYDRDAYVNFDRLPDLLRQNQAWRAERIAPTFGLPHFERLEETTQAIDRFWAELD